MYTYCNSFILSSERGGESHPCKSPVIDSSPIPLINEVSTAYRPAYPKTLLSVLRKAAVRIFRFWPDFFFCWCTTNHSKRSSVKGQFFYYSSCKKSVWTHIFNYTEALHSENFILLTSANVVLDRRPLNTFSKTNALCVLLSLMPTCPFFNVCGLVGVCFLGFVPSSSSSSVLCSYLSPTASNPPHRKMANFRKLSMQSWCSLV